MNIQNQTEYEKKNLKAVAASRIDLEGSTFTETHFEHCDFSESKFNKCTFDKCSFTNTNFANSKFPNTKFIECHFTDCKMLGIDWSSLSTEFGLTLHCSGCDLSYSIFAETDISKSKFLDCKIHESDFTKSTAKSCVFEGTDLHDSIFFKTNLENVDFRKAINFFFDPSQNWCKHLKISLPEAANLLAAFQIEVEQ